MKFMNTPEIYLHPVSKMYFSMKLIIMICIYTAIASDYKTIVSLSTLITSVTITDNGGTFHSYHTS